MGISEAIQQQHQCPEPEIGRVRPRTLRGPVGVTEEHRQPADHRSDCREVDGQRDELIVVDQDGSGYGQRADQVLLTG